MHPRITRHTLQGAVALANHGRPLTIDGGRRKQIVAQIASGALERRREVLYAAQDNN